MRNWFYVLILAIVAPLQTFAADTKLPSQIEVEIGARLELTCIHKNKRHWSSGLPLIKSIISRKNGDKSVTLPFFETYFGRSNAYAYSIPQELGVGDSFTTSTPFWYLAWDGEHKGFSSMVTATIVEIKETSVVFDISYKS
jgi:hypothetical protein